MGRKNLMATIALLLTLSALMSGHAPIDLGLPLDPQAAPAETSAPAAQEEIITLPGPNQAVLWALADVQTLPPATQGLVRYIWLERGKIEDLKSATINLNIISRAPLALRAYPLMGGQLLRVHLDRYAPRAEDLAEWLKFWEDLQFDPRFSLFLTKDALELTQRLLGNIITDEQIQKLDEVDVIRLNGGHIDRNALLQLQLLTRSQAPVVSDAYFGHRVLSTVKDKGLYAVLFGGRYYEFAGIKKAKQLQGKENFTDLDVFLEECGIGNLQAGVTADKLFDKLRSDQRVAIFRSGVTGKPRRVDWYHGPDNRDGTGAISVTHDLRNDQIDIKTHPIMNLIDIKAGAYEAIAEKTNGLHKYAIFDDKQALLDVADATNIVADRTIPAPHTPSLQSAISCIACHEADGSDGWKTLTNDVKKITGGALDIFADVGNLNKLQSDVIDRAAGLYAGDFSKHLRRARDDYAEVLLKTAGPWPQTQAQVDVVKVSMGHTVDRVRNWWYDMVTPAQALAELGYQAPKGKEVATLKSILPPDPNSRLGSIFLEDPRIGALKRGESIPRTDWALAYGFAAARAQQTIQKMKQKKE